METEHFGLWYSRRRQNLLLWHSQPNFRSDFWQFHFWTVIKTNEKRVMLYNMYDTGSDTDRTTKCICQHRLRHQINKCPGISLYGTWFYSRKTSAYFLSSFICILFHAANCPFHYNSCFFPNNAAMLMLLCQHLIQRKLIQ